MKNFSLKDETGKIYYGWYIVLTAAIICGPVSYTHLKGLHTHPYIYHHFHKAS